MENTYGIGVANRYALFLEEEEDPLEVLKVQELEKEAKKKNKLSEKENKGKPESKGKVAPAARKGIKDAQNVKSVDSSKAKEDNNRTKAPPRSAPERGDRNVKFAGESREERNNRRNREDRPYPGSGEPNRDGRDGRDGPRPEGGEIRGRGRGGARGIGRGRGARGGGDSGVRNSGGMGRAGGYDSRGKREFDRQSGSDKTGVKPVDKREGGGAHNWGSHKDDIADELRSPHSHDDQEWTPEKTEDAPATSDLENKEGTPPGEGENENAHPADEEPRELTLDEYYAMKGSRQKPTYNLRKAGEGEDLSQWKKMYALKKKEGDEEEEEDEEYDVSEYPQRVGRQKHLLDIDIHFADSRRGTRGRGRGGPRGAGRGGSRGGGGGGGAAAAAAVAAGGGGGAGVGVAAVASPGGSSGGPPRGPSGEGRSPPAARGFGDRSEAYHRTQRQSAPKVDDEHDFPSLG